MTQAVGGNAGGAAKRAGGGSGKRVQGSSKGVAAANKMQGYKTVKQVGGNRNAPSGK